MYANTQVAGDAIGYYLILTKGFSYDFSREGAVLAGGELWGGQQRDGGLRPLAVCRGWWCG